MYFTVQFLDVFFMDPDFSGSHPDFWLIRIRTQEQKFEPDPGKKKPGFETLHIDRLQRFADADFFFSPRGFDRRISLTLGNKFGS